VLKGYKCEGDTTNVKFVLAPGDSFTAITGDVHMIRPGIVVVMQPTNNFSPGDTLYTPGYYGEGIMEVWCRDTLLDVEMFWNVDFADSTNNINNPKWSEYKGVLLSRALMVWWVRIRDRNGSEGWLRLQNNTDSGFGLDVRIDGMDGCG